MELFSRPYLKSPFFAWNIEFVALYRPYLIAGIIKGIPKIKLERINPYESRVKHSGVPFLVTKKEGVFSIFSLQDIKSAFGFFLLILNMLPQIKLSFVGEGGYTQAQ